jgi:hypothetical protein
MESSIPLAKFIKNLLYQEIWYIEGKFNYCLHLIPIYQDFTSGQQMIFLFLFIIKKLIYYKYIIYYISSIDAAQIQNNLGFGIWYLNLGFGT